LAFVFALALGLAGCGGGGGTNNVSEQGTTQTDTTPPSFAANIKTNFAVDENTRDLDLVTVEVEDESPVHFFLIGPDADYFNLKDPATRALYSKVISFDESPDFEEKSSYQFTLLVKDDYNNSASKDFNVTVNDKPFVFDMVTGSMGPVVEGQTKLMPLITKEAKRTPSYTLTGDDAFSIVSGSNVLQFVAPAYMDGGDNNYSTIVTADDGNREINLTVTAYVIENTSAPVQTRVFLLREKRDIQQNRVTIYDYDDNHYLIHKKITQGGDGSPEDEIWYVYEEGHSIMKGKIKVNNVDELWSLRAFVDGEEDTTSDYIVDKRLSLRDDIRFIYKEGDSVSFNDQKRINKYVYSISYGQSIAERYFYKENGQIERIVNGEYDTTPQRPFATLDYNSTLNAALVSDDETVLPEFFPSYENVYEYNEENVLSGIAYLDSNDEANNRHASVDVTFNETTHKLDDLIITDDLDANSKIKIDYSGDGYLNEIESGGAIYKYHYDLEHRRVYVTRGDQNITTYIFEEVE